MRHIVDLEPWPNGIEPRGSHIYAAARRLLAAGADPADTVETWRKGPLCMSGKIGELAEWTIRENKHGNPTLQLVHWEAFPTIRVAPRTAKVPEWVE